MENPIPKRNTGKLRPSFMERITAGWKEEWHLWLNGFWTQCQAYRASQTGRKYLSFTILTAKKSISRVFSRKYKGRNMDFFWFGNYHLHYHQQWQLKYRIRYTAELSPHHLSFSLYNLDERGRGGGQWQSSFTSFCLPPEMSDGSWLRLQKVLLLQTTFLGTNNQMHLLFKL